MGKQNGEKNGCEESKAFQDVTTCSGGQCVGTKDQGTNQHQSTVQQCPVTRCNNNVPVNSTSPNKTDVTSGSLKWR